MNQLDKQYQELLFDIIERGVDKDTRNGKTRSVFGKQIRHEMKDGFPLLTTKKMYWKGIVTELLWFLRGDTNIKFLVDNGVHIWDGDAYKKYSHHFIGYEDVPNQEWFIDKIKTDFKFAEKWGDLGPVYGKQWRKWHFNAKFDMNGKYHEEKGIDQIENLINDLKTNPDSRRLMVSAWNVGELDQMTLPPCHYGFQTYTRELTTKDRLKIWIDRCTDAEYKQGLEEAFNDWNNPKWAHGVFETDMDDAKIPTRAISLMWNQRSVDTFLGLPFNIASYGLLLEIIAKMTNMVPDELIGNLGDTHLYHDHMSQAREQLVREPYALPKLWINDEFWATENDVKHLDTDVLINSMLIEDFQIEDYQSHAAIKAPLST
jgi:thymidylate synthase